MKMERSEIYQIGGVGLLVGALFSAAKALAGILTLIYLAFALGLDSLGKDFVNKLQSILLAPNIASIGHDIVTCVILIFGARWLMSGPELIDRWMDRGGKKPD